MGQRLCINFNKNNETIAAVYYHWGGYSASALSHLNYLYEMVILPGYTDINEFKLKLVRALEVDRHKAIREKIEETNIPEITKDMLLHCTCLLGGLSNGKNGEEYKYMKSLFPNEEFVDNPHRNAGLVSFTKNGIQSINSWAEGVMDVDLDTLTVQNDVFEFWEDVNALNDFFDETYKEEEIVTIQKDGNKYYPESFELKDTPLIWKSVMEEPLLRCRNGEIARAIE